tara:strand:- start:5276 stop:6328 length:1053 start_codon:yes stop_codon:yes gene_type:complete
MPGWMYTSPDVFQRETERIFLKDWLIVGRVEEVPEPGNYFTFDIVDEPVVVTRGKDGQLNAVSNVCRHRGAKVVEGRGTAKVFSCPYHGWTYDIGGALIQTTFTDDVSEFDFDNCRLSPVQIGSWGGWIFVSFDPGAGPLEEHVALYDEKLGYFHQEDCRLSDTLVIESDVNWKLMAENFIDVYHFRTLHAGTFGNQKNPATSLSYDEDQVIIYRLGGKSLTPTGEMLLGRLPWLTEDDPSEAGHMPPNAYFTCHADNVQLWMSWPISPSRSRIMIYTIFSEEQLARNDFDEHAETYHEFVARILNEDVDMVAALQKTVGSRNFEPGPITQLEAGVHGTVNHLIDRIFDD